jgi:hypothetical protein
MILGAFGLVVEQDGRRPLIAQNRYRKQNLHPFFQSNSRQQSDRIWRRSTTTGSIEMRFLSQSSVA